MQIISGRGVNGALVYCKILSEELVDRGHQVTIICKPKSWVKANVDQSKVRVIESTLRRFPLGELKRVAKLVRDQQIDLIHTHMTRGQNFGVALKLMTGVPVVATAHNRHFELHWNFNDFVIANSSSTFDYHRRVNLVPEKRMKTIYCCSDLEHLKQVSDNAVSSIRKNLTSSPDDFLIGLIGEIAIRKGHKYLVQALPAIIKQVPNTKVVFVGRFGRKQPHVRKLRKFILENNLAGRIKWTGRQSNVAEYLSACDVTVMPSIEEPLGLVAIESLMAGTPVVASATGGLVEIVRPNENGLLVPPANPTALADAVIQLAQDSDLRMRLGSQGRQSVGDKFAPRTLIDQVEQIYHQLLPNVRAA